LAQIVRGWCDKLKEMIAASIPRFLDPTGLRSDPLWFLKCARQAGDVIVILEDDALFSLAPDCRGTVAVFGPAAIKQVLDNPDVFGMAVSVAQRFSLPPRLVRLNAGLFSMRGERHRVHQQLLMTLLRRSNVAEYGAAIQQGWEVFRKDVTYNRDVHLLAEMRRLVLNVSGRLMFGEGGIELSRTIQHYFETRRNFSKAEAAPDLHDGSNREMRRDLVRRGLRLDSMLRERLADLQRGSSSTSGDQPRDLFSKLAQLRYESGEMLSDDEYVAHANILFTSGSEPMAVALTWTLLLLSQHRDILQAARQEIAQVFPNGELPPYSEESALPTVRAAVLESLRVLPPNAVMVRLAARDGEILGHSVPEGCEIVLSPYVAHRDPSQWADPDCFDPSRWRGSSPSPYVYLPFGAGNRYCLGKHFATHILVSLLARIIREFGVVFAAEEAIDWKMHINLMPAEDPAVRFAPTGSALESSGLRLRGPVIDLIHGRRRR
jgi:cytochrome P450